MNKLIDHTTQHGSLSGFVDGCERITNDELLQLECDVLIPAALERQITGKMLARFAVASWLRRRTGRPPSRLMPCYDSGTTFS